MKTYNEFIRDYLENLDDIELIDQWNGYCLENDMDNYINDNDENFFEDYFSNNINEAIRAVCYGDYRYMDDYVVFNGYANLDSFSGYDLKDHIYISDLASYLEDNGFLLDEYELIKEQEKEA